MANGFFAKGLAQGLNNNSMPLTSAAVKRENVKRKAQKDLFERATKQVNQIDDAKSQIVKVAQNLAKNGDKVPQRLERAYTRFNRMGNFMRKRVGMPGDPGTFREQVAATMTPEEKRDLKAKAQRAASRASAEGTTEGQISSARRVADTVSNNPELERALQGQGALPSRSPAFTNYAISVDGKTRMQTFDENDPEDAEQLRSMMDDPEVRIQRMPTSVQATSVEGARGTPISEGDREEAVGDLTTMRQNMVSVGQLAQRVEEVGAGAGFIRRNIVSGLGGYIGQIFPQAERALGNMVGVSPEDARQLEIEMRRTAARLIEPITGEESGRKTETEREIANRVSSMDVANASPAQIGAALPSIYSLWLQRLSRKEIEAGNDLTFDLVDDQGNQNQQGMLDMVDEMEGFGFPESAQERILSNMIVMQRELKQLDLGRDPGGTSR